MALWIFLPGSGWQTEPCFHLCLHFSVLCPCESSCLPLGPQSSLSLLNPLEGLRESESSEQSASRWVTSSFLRGCLSWILPTPQFPQEKTKIKLPALREVLAAQVWPGLRPSPLPAPRWQWSSDSQVFAWILLTSAHGAALLDLLAEPCRPWGHWLTLQSPSSQPGAETIQGGATHHGSRGGLCSYMLGSDFLE